MSAFTITSSNGNSMAFTSSMATDTRKTKPFYGINRGAEESAGGSIKQQIRPGKRFNKVYEYNLTEAQYITWNNLITDQSDYYYITYDTVPSLLSNDSSITNNNDFKISINPKEPSSTAGSEDIIYKFDVIIQSVNLL